MLGCRKVKGVQFISFLSLNFFFFFSFFNLQLRGAFLFRGAINKCFLHALNNNTSNWIDWLFFYLKGHEQDALKLMSTYLPKDGSGGSAYQEGGGLFALGNGC